MKVELDINRQKHTVEVEPRTSLLDCLRDKLLLNGAHAGCEHGVCGACTVLIDGAAVRSCLMFAVQADGYAITTIEGLSPGPGELSPLQDAFCETHGMQCGYCTPAMILAAHALLVEERRSRPARRSSTRSPATSAAAPAMRRSSRRLRSPPSACAARTSRRQRHERAGQIPLRLVRPPRARGPPLRRRQGQFRRRYRAAGRQARRAGDVPASGGAHRLDRQVRGAGDARRALRARRRGACRRDQRCSRPASTRRTCRAGRSRWTSRAMPANGSRRWWPTRRALAEDAAEAVAVEYEPLPFVLDGEEAYRPAACWCIEAHGSNVLLDRTFVWGEVEKDFAASPHKLKHRVKWGRSATVPIETFGVTASWDPWREILDVWASIQMPKYPDQTAMALKLPMSSVRVHYDVDVGGSYGVKRGIKHTVLVGYLSRRLGVPVRLIEDRLENMRGGDMHGPERNFDVEVAFDDQGVIRSMKMRALDNVGAYAGRSPFQLGKPVGAIVGPYKIKSVQYQAIAVVTNKTVQEAVRAFGQSPTNYAIERTIDEVANKLGLDRLEVRRRNLIRHEEFPYLIPSGSTYDSGDYHAVIDKVLAQAGYAESGRRARPAARRRARSPASASPRAWSRPAATRRSSRCSIPRSAPPPGWTPAASASISSARSPRPCTPRRPGRATRRWSAPWSARCWRSIPTRCGWCAPDSLNSLPSNSPVGSRMAIMLGGAAFHAAQQDQGQAHRHRRARSRRAGRAHRLQGRQCVRHVRAGQEADLGRTRHHRAPPHPQAAAGHGAGAFGEPHHAGADRRRAADGRRPGADVSLLLVRIPPDAGDASIPISASPRSSATSSATTAAP